jgi:prepilin-type N-terminal cleavage/methylation domain-containing protein
MNVSGAADGRTVQAPGREEAMDDRTVRTGTVTGGETASTRGWFAPAPIASWRQVAGRGFSLVELLVAIVIIAVLIGILIPVITSVRRSAYSADTSSFIAQLSAAIERYHMDFSAYPGPIPNNLINGLGGSTPAISNRNLGPSEGDPDTATEITMSENLTLGLLGGLQVDTTKSGAERFYFEPSVLGRGPMSLNPANPKRHAAYMNADPKYLTPANQNFTDAAGRRAFDTHIPEFIDRYPDGLPILYMRARSGAPGVAGRSFRTPLTQYDVDQVTGYTLQGEGGKHRDENNSLGIKPGTYHGLRYTTDGSSPGQGDNPQFPTTNQDPKTLGIIEYLTSSTSPSEPIRKDSYILISAGPDRYYGSHDDITNVGTLPAR